MAILLEVEPTQGVTSMADPDQDNFATLVFFLALASWCARNALKRPSASVLAVLARGAPDPDANGPVPHCAAPLPARPRPALLGASNSSPGACNVRRPPSRGISPPACSRSINPPAGVAGSREGTHAASSGTRSNPPPLLDSSPTPTPPAGVPPRHPPSLPTTAPAVPSPTRGDVLWGLRRHSFAHNIVSEDATSTQSSPWGTPPSPRTRVESRRRRRPRPTTGAHR